jgi:predicted HAD superfamily phosphohydrolase
VKYLNAVVPSVDDTTRAELEDFAFESTRLLIDQRAGTSMRDSIFQLWASAGIDPGEAMTALAAERDVIAEEIHRTGGRMGPVSGFVIPTLKAVGLFSDRIAGHFEEMWAANMNPEAARRMATNLGEMPEDLEAWVDEGYEAL